MFEIAINQERSSLFQKDTIFKMTVEKVLK